MTQDQRESILLTKYVAPANVQESLLSGGKKEKPRMTEKRLVNMAPYEPGVNKWEEQTKTYSNKIVPRMGFRYKDEGKKFYDRAYPDKKPEPGAYYSYEQHHKHFFKTAKGIRIPEKTKTKRFNKKENNYPSPGHYKARLTITRPTHTLKSFGYRFEEKHRNQNPGPGTYKVRSKLKTQKPDDEMLSPKISESPKKRKGKKKRSKSGAGTARSKKSRSKKKFQNYFDKGSRPSSQQVIDFRRTSNGFST